jgi:hypothetical protein
MKHILFLLLIIISFSCTSRNDKTKKYAYKESGQWIKIFNGKNLDGWICKFAGGTPGENYKNTFRVEAGILKVDFDEYTKFDNNFGHLFYDKKLSNYKIRVEYRFVGKQVPGSPKWAYKNNGIMIHSQSPQSMGKDQWYPVAIEVQLVGGNGKEKRPTAGVCTSGTNIRINGKVVPQHCTPSLAKTYSGDEWVTVEVVVRNNTVIQHFVDGKKVLEYTGPTVGSGNGKPDDYPVPEGTPLKDGFIAIQSEGYPTEFRKIELMKLEIDQ